MIAIINAWIEGMNRKSARIMQAIEHEKRTLIREERWAEVGKSVRAELKDAKGIKIEGSHFGIDIIVDSLDGLHAARVAFGKAIPDYVDEIKSVEPEYVTIYTVAEIIERDEKIEIKYGYNGLDPFYGGAAIYLKVPYSQVPKSIFKDGKCGLKETKSDTNYVSFVCENKE